MTSPTFRSSISLLQNYPRHKSFTFTTTDAQQNTGSPDNGPGYETAVDITSAMQECNKISLIVEVADAYIEFDGDAGVTSMLIPMNEGYFDDAVFIGSKISIKREAVTEDVEVGTNARIRGIIWGR